MGLLDGKVAVITGAGSGMGKSSAELFAAEGARCSPSTSPAPRRRSAAAFGDEVIATHCDVSKEDDVIAAFDLAMRIFGRVDSVLNVAGISGTPKPLHEVTVDDFDTVMGVNLLESSSGSTRRAGHARRRPRWLDRQLVVHRREPSRSPARRALQRVQGRHHRRDPVGRPRPTARPGSGRTRSARASSP